MKKIFLALAATTALAAVPAAAQSSAQSNVNAAGSVGIDNRLDRLEDRLYDGIRSGEIDRTEARSLRQQLRTLRRLEARYERDGLTQAERMDLNQRIRAFRQDMRLADGGNRRWDRPGDEDDGYYGQGGPVEGDGWVVDDTGGGRSGVGGFVDSFLGRGGLRVGQRVTGNLYAVPGEFRNQFRDNSSVYFRSDGSRVYEIDARTNTVVRIYRRDTE